MSSCVQSCCGDDLNRTFNRNAGGADRFVDPSIVGEQLLFALAELAQFDRLIGIELWNCRKHWHLNRGRIFCRGFRVGRFKDS